MRHSDRMPRSRHLTLLALPAALALTAPVPALAQSCGTYVNARPSSANTVQIREATLCLVNNERARAGLPALAHNPTLEASAQWTSDDMVRRRYFDHTTPDGRGLSDKMADYIAPAMDWNIGENLAWGERHTSTPANTVVAWMNSPGHRANILNGEFREGGIGVTVGTPGGNPDGGSYANHFGTRRMEPAAPAPAATTAPAAKRKPASKRRSRCLKTVTAKVGKRTIKYTVRRGTKSCRKALKRRR